MVSLKLKLPVNTFQSLATCFGDVEFTPEEDSSTPVEFTLQISEETANKFLQSYKDLFPMMILSAPHLFAPQEDDEMERRTISQEEFLEMIQQQQARKNKSRTKKEKNKNEDIEKIGYA